MGTTFDYDTRMYVDVQVSWTIGMVHSQVAVFAEKDHRKVVPA